MTTSYSPAGLIECAGRLPLRVDALFDEMFDAAQDATANVAKRAGLRASLSDAIEAFRKVVIADIDAATVAAPPAIVTKKEPSHEPEKRPMQPAHEYLSPENILSKSATRALMADPKLTTEQAILKALEENPLAYDAIEKAGWDAPHAGTWTEDDLRKSRE